MKYFVVALALLAACSDSAGPNHRRGDPFTVVVSHFQLSDSLAQHYDLYAIIDEAGSTPPQSAPEGGVDSAQVANGFAVCFSLNTDSLGARQVWMELRSSLPAATGDTLRSPHWDPGAVPSADSALGYGQSSVHPYAWHWYVSNDSSVVRGDTTKVC